MGLIRFLLALAVATGHASGFSYFPGKTAVQAFYIISGFYMSLILNEKYVGKKNSYKLFITNRFLRLYPSYWVVLLLTIIYSLIIYQVTDHKDGGKLTAYFQYHDKLNFTTYAYLIFTNIGIFFQDLVCFVGLNSHSGSMFFTTNFYNSQPPVYLFLLIPPAWTLGLELVYYLMAPFIVKRSLYIVLVLIACSFVLRLIFIKIGLYNDPWSYRFFPLEILFFLLGNVSYKIYVYVKSKMERVKNNSVIFSGLFYFIVAFTIFYEFSLSYFEPRYIQILYFLLFFLSLPFIFIYTGNSRLDRFIGELSYPIYISHILIIEVCNHLNMTKGVKYSTLIAALSILFAVLINKLLNDRIEKYRQKRVSAKKIVLAPPIPNQ